MITISYPVYNVDGDLAAVVCKLQHVWTTSCMHHANYCHLTSHSLYEHLMMVNLSIVFRWPHSLIGNIPMVRHVTSFRWLLSCSLFGHPVGITVVLLCCQLMTFSACINILVMIQLSDVCKLLLTTVVVIQTYLFVVCRWLPYHSLHEHPQVCRATEPGWRHISGGNWGSLFKWGNTLDRCWQEGL